MKALFAFLVVASASMFGGWDPFHRPNPDVEEGNARVAAENYDGALEAYDLAARELPSAPGVHLNRGIAYLHKGDRERAREALLMAIAPETPAALLADVRYNLGLSFFQDGEAAAAEDDHTTAQTAFRAAVDEYRRSLRARPSDPNTAWNLELALRRLNEEQEEQEQQEQQEQEQEQQDQQEQQDPQDGEDPQDPQDGEDQQEPQDGEDQEQQDSQDSQDGQDGQDEPSQPEPGEDQQDQQGQEGSGEQDEPQDSQDDGSGQPMQTQAERMLDALRDGEESLERYRAAQRGQRENRRVEQDW